MQMEKMRCVLNESGALRECASCTQVFKRTHHHNIKVQEPRHVVAGMAPLPQQRAHSALERVRPTVGNEQSHSSLSAMQVRRRVGRAGRRGSIAIERADDDRARVCVVQVLFLTKKRPCCGEVGE
jgi:hypothetical protein